MINAGTYTCPMHSDVVSDQPGNCPKCGMKLVPRESIDHNMIRETVLKQPLQDRDIPPATFLLPG